MLVFVVTNELFDSYLAEHFRKLAIDKDKAGEMILVVNKMDRASDGNTEIQQNVIREDLRKVLTPYTPEQLNLCFLDEISYSAISSADMLVFVVTNELFDSYLAEHFRKLAIDKDKAGEMILVVNKMDRASDGNTEIQQNVIREDLRKVLTPYTPEQLNLCFLDAESYLDSLKEREDDPEIADELYERSGYAEFVETLNSFVTEKKIPAKLTTGLYVLEDALEKAVHDLEPK